MVLWLMFNIPMYAFAISFSLMVIGLIFKLCRKPFKKFFDLATFSLYVPVGLCMLVAFFSFAY